MTNTPHQRTFGVVASALKSNGYLPLPVRVRSKAPAVVSDWPDFRLNGGIDPHFVDMQTGIIVGEQVIPVDADIYGEAEAEALRELADEILGDGAPERIGRAPKWMRLYRLDGQHPGHLTTGKYTHPSTGDDRWQIEILGPRQQFVTFGLHPDTGAAYTWHNGDPLTVKMEDLPVVTPEQVAVFMSEASEGLNSNPQLTLFKESKLPGGEKGAGGPGRLFMTAPLKAMNPELAKEALRHIPNKDLSRSSWIRVGMAIKGAFGDEGKALFVEWSRQSRKSGSSGKPNTPEVTYDGFNPKWIGAGTLVHYARQYGWDPAPGMLDGWPPPVNIWDDIAAIASPLEDTLPPALKTWAEAEAARLAVDPVQLVAVALPVIAAAISDDWKFQPKQHDAVWQECARLWAMVVVEVGGRKTDSINSAAAPVEALERLWSDEYNGAMFEWGKDCARAKEDKVDPPDPPQRKRLVSTDTTVEKLSEILREDGHYETPTRKMLVKAGELTQWIYGMEAYKSGKQSASRPDWLKAYDGGFAMIDRIGRGTIPVPNWSACVVGVIQPDPIAKIGRSLGTDGLLQRFMIVEPHQPKQPENDDTPTTGGEQARQAFEQTVKRLPQITPRMHAASNGPLTADDGARKWRAKLRARRLRLDAAAVYPRIMRGWTAKWDGLWARLALTFHIFHTVATTPDPARKIGPVSEDAGRWAHTFIKQVLEPHAAKFYGQTLGLGDEFEHRDELFAIAGWVLTNQMAQTTRREVQRSSGGRKYTAEGIIAVMSMLEDRGWCDTLELDSQRKPRAWRINPRIYTDLVPQMEDEKRRRREAWELIQKEAAKRRDSRAHGDSSDK